MVGTTLETADAGFPEVLIELPAEVQLFSPAALKIFFAGFGTGRRSVFHLSTERRLHAT
jgi:hypothetical protein